MGLRVERVGCSRTPVTSGLFTALPRHRWLIHCSPPSQVAYSLLSPVTGGLFTDLPRNRWIINCFAFSPVMSGLVATLPVTVLLSLVKDGLFPGLPRDGGLSNCSPP